MRTGSSLPSWPRRRARNHPGRTPVGPAAPTARNEGTPGRVTTWPPSPTGSRRRLQHPGWAQRAAKVGRHTYTAERVIVAAHAYGSAKLLHRMQHKGRLTGLSSQLGQRARTNSEQLLYVTRPYREWKEHPERVRITPGSVTITSGVWPDAVTSVEPTYWGVGSNVHALLGTYHQHGDQDHGRATPAPVLTSAPSTGRLRETVERTRAEPGLRQGSDGCDGHGPKDILLRRQGTATPRPRTSVLPRNQPPLMGVRQGMVGDWGLSDNQNVLSVYAQRFRDAAVHALAEERRRLPPAPGRPTCRRFLAPTSPQAQHPDNQTSGRSLVQEERQ